MRLKLIVLLTYFVSQSAWAFYTFQDTGELLKDGQKRFLAEGQLVTSGDKGVNIIGRYDMAYDDESNVRFMVGTGTTDFQIGGFFKWVPFPDYDRQPAIGFTFGAHMAHYEGENDLALRIIPFASKKFDTNNGEFTPYAALPVAFSNYNKEHFTPVQLVLGTQYSHPDLKHCDFTAELGFDLNDAFTYISVGAVFPAFE